uniref:Uncharacterized protein n=1 Tax=Anguilla anguilla TaxID=7936 RepID=A0A0E9SGH9_ANGAN
MHYTDQWYSHQVTRSISCMFLAHSNFQGHYGKTTTIRQTMITTTEQRRQKHDK